MPIKLVSCRILTWREGAMVETGLSAITVIRGVSSKIWLQIRSTTKSRMSIVMRL